MPRQYAPRASVAGAKSAATRARILEVAQVIVEEQGVDALDTKTLALMAEVSIGSVYRYWKNKHDILQEIHPELADLDAKLQQVKKVNSLSISDADKWLKVKELLHLE